MWADSIITVFTMITVATKNLITGRIRVVLEPFVEFGSMLKKSSFLSESVPVIIDVIQIQEKALRLSATGTTISAISVNSLVLEPVVIGKGVLSALNRIVLIPLCSTFGIAFKNVRLMQVFFQPFLGPFGPITPVSVNTFRTLPTMPLGLILRLAALRACFYHGITSVIKTLSDYGIIVKGKAQRPERNLVGASVPKRLAARTAEDMVCSAWERAAALNWAV
jgi:succinate dehydrogenase/fumarate reductase cytochrome b subunit